LFRLHKQANLSEPKFQPLVRDGLSRRQTISLIVLLVTLLGRWAGSDVCSCIFSGNFFGWFCIWLRRACIDIAQAALGEKKPVAGALIGRVLMPRMRISPE
jgi:hypothetical protein